jgi:DNA-binding IclR family transcriptional regulator
LKHTTNAGTKLFHLANQAESRANVRLAAQNQEIAELTAELAQRTQRDSAAMITIAAVTMFFLPGTFVAVCTSIFVISATQLSVNITNGC